MQTTVIQNKNNISSIELAKCQFQKPCVNLVYNDEDSGAKNLIPLKSSHMDCLIYDGLATMNLQFEFTNQLIQNPVETTLEFPCDKKTIVTKVIADIDDRVVEAKVDKKEKAEEKYDDAVAKGHTATLVEKQKNDDGFTLKLGNLHPGKVATVNIQLSKFLEVELGAFAFRMPTNYFPDYSAIKKIWEELPMYTFSYKLEIKSFKPITYLSAPENTNVEQLVQQKHVVVSSQEEYQAPKRDMMLYFKTSDMGLPNLKAQFSDKYPDEVALLTSFVPTFEQKQPQESMELFEEEVPEQSPLNPNEKYCFMFLIDRSGSMSGDRIQTAKNALKLFLKSLPPGSIFQVTSFGTEFKHLCWQVMPYDDGNLERSLAQIDSFRADFGGTDIYKPLEQLLRHTQIPEGYVKRLFVLTDGCVSNKQVCIDLVRQNSHNARVQTFGIGKNCDKQLVEGMASAGRGTASFADDNTNDLKSLVIKALKCACEPSLKDCQLQWVNKVEKLGEVHRNDMITSTQIVTKEQFESINVQFSSSEDPVTKAPIKLSFNKTDFEIVEEGDHLFKHGAQSLIKNEVINDKVVQLSTKYQVLCDQTAMIAVVKQKEKTTGEMKEFNVPLGKLYQKPVIPQSFKGYGGFGGAAVSSSSRSYGFGGGAMCSKPASYAAPKSSNYSFGGFGGSAMSKPAKSAMKNDVECLMSSNANIATDASTQNSSIWKALTNIFSGNSQASNNHIDQQIEAKMQQKQEQRRLEREQRRQERELKKQQKQDSQMMMSMQSAMSMQCEMMSDSYGMKASYEPTKQSYAQQYQSNDVGMCCAAQASYSSAQQSQEMDDLEARLAALSDSPVRTVQKSTVKSQYNSLEVGLSNQSSNQSKPPSTPTFEELINQQSSSGYWSDSCNALLCKFFTQNSIEDKNLYNKLKQLNSNQLAQIWHTIIALYILEQKFGHIADEWEMIARKATSWLKQNGIAKPQSFIKEVNFKVQMTEIYAI